MLSVRLVQISHPGQGRRVGLVEEPRLRLLRDCESLVALAAGALCSGARLGEQASNLVGDEVIDYDALYAGQADWRLLSPADHPQGASRVLVSGTGLTHLGSALRRQAMHQANPAASEETDSLRMFRWGVEGGKPAAGQVGAQPEWFYKGRGEILRAHGEPLEIPEYADDGGEEAEVAFVYYIADDGTPCRLGACQGNEFSDHIMEKKNYLYLAPSKLRTCSLGPELVTDVEATSFSGEVRIERAGQTLWSHALASGETHMSHTLANLEHHHFKYASHRQPGDVHVHYWGADAFSFSEKLELADCDAMVVSFAGLGRPLRNPVRRVPRADRLIAVREL